MFCMRCTCTEVCIHLSSLIYCFELKDAADHSWIVCMHLSNAHTMCDVSVFLSTLMWVYVQLGHVKCNSIKCPVLRCENPVTNSQQCCPRCAGIASHFCRFNKLICMILVHFYLNSLTYAYYGYSHNQMSTELLLVCGHPLKPVGIMEAFTKQGKPLPTTSSSHPVSRTSASCALAL